MLKLEFDTQNIDRRLQNLGKTELAAVITNDAKSADGFFYWHTVNDGRGPIRPVKAKVLHWIDPETGKDVFAMYAGPAPAQHIRENAMASIRSRAQAVLDSEAHLDRDAVARIVNKIARIAVEELESRTPGKVLPKSYKIKEAL